MLILADLHIFDYRIYSNNIKRNSLIIEFKFIKYVHLVAPW